MKTAIILTGLNRSKLNYYLNHKEIIDKYNADVYISTYNTPKENGYLSIQEMLDLYTPIKIDIEEYSRIEPQFQKLVDNIQWRDYQIKNQFRFVPKPINVCSMWYKIQKGFDIIDNEYDVYIRMRFDNTFDNTLEVETPKAEVITNEIKVKKERKEKDTKKGLESITEEIKTNIIKMKKAN